MLLFEKSIFSSVQNEVVTAMLEAIAAERRGERTNRNSLKSAVEVWPVLFFAVFSIEFVVGVFACLPEWGAPLEAECSAAGHLAGLGRGWVCDRCGP